MNTTQNGPSDPSRETQGPAEEGAWRQVWKSEACAPDGGSPRGAQGNKPRTLYVENSSEMRGPHTMTASHTDDVITFLQTIRKIDTQYIGIQIASHPMGILQRKVFENCAIPDEIDFLHARFFLKKHPPLGK